MSYRIDQIEDAIKTAIETALTGEGGVRVFAGTPEDYLVDGGSEFPLITVTLANGEPLQDCFPGSVAFTIYYVNNLGSGNDPNKTNRMKLYAYIKSVFDALNKKTAGLTLNGYFKGGVYGQYRMEGLMAYEQNWTCTAL